MFKKESDGRKNRDWRSMDEQQIRDLHLKCKSMMDDVIADFKYIKIPKSLKDREFTAITKTDGNGMH